MMLYYLSSMLMLMISMMMMWTSMFLLKMKMSYFMEWNIFEINSINLHMYMYIDWISLLFMSTVLLISSMIMLYCCEYMSHDNYNIRFFFLVLLFILSMLFMIISPNLISILIGWDGLGLISYLLVIYYQNYSSFNSGMLTVLLNRIGDVMILLSACLLMISGNWNIINNIMMNNLLIFLIIIAGFTKSAQFPFSSWLPAAMAAPTPVSSLVHSSTLVTAGVYLLIRFHEMIFNNINFMNFIMLIGLITMLMAGMSANFEFDMKKIIAYSTLSQLGLMMMMLGFKNWELSYFHLIIHAMFKSMMFMCSGVLIHSMLNYQDIRKMSKLVMYYPFTFSMLMISNLSLCGVPFMSGFYSKDQILENMFLSYMNLMIYLLLLLSTGLTVAYSIRMIYYLMNDYIKFLTISKMNDFKMMNFPMLILMILSILFGLMLNWIIFNNIENIFLEKMEKMMILMICITFIMIGKINYQTLKIKNNKLIKMFLGKLWFMYNFIPMIIFIPLNLSKLYLNYYDKGWSEFFMKNSFYNMNNNLNLTNSINNNMMFMLMSFTFIILLFFII